MKTHHRSERTFGLVWGAVFLALGIYPWWAGAGLRVWALVVAAALFGVAFMRPEILAPLSRAWIKLGEVLHRIVSPVVLGMMYAVIVVPVGLGMRLMGRDVLQVRKRPCVDSYWLVRADGVDHADRFQRQF